MKKRFIISIKGRVQGVGFRYFVSQKAEEYGISGFVQNKDDKSVHIDAEGDSVSMKNFICFLFIDCIV